MKDFIRWLANNPPLIVKICAALMVIFAALFQLTFVSYLGFELGKPISASLVLFVPYLLIIFLFYINRDRDLK